MSIVVRAQTNSGNVASASSPQTWNHSTDAPTIAVVVVITMYDTSSSDGVVTAVSFDGKALTDRLVEFDAAADAHISVWDRINADVASISNGVVSVTFNGVVTDFVAEIIGLSTTAGSLAFDSADTKNIGNGPTMLTSWSSVETSDALIAFGLGLNDQKDPKVTITTGTSLYIMDVGSDILFAGYNYYTGGTSTPELEWDESDGDEDWMVSGCAYVEAAGAILVYKDLEAVWDMREFVSKDIEGLWDIFDLVNKDIEGLWDIFDLVNKDIEGVWDIRELVFKDIEAIWDMSGAVSKDLEAVWDITELVNKDLEILFDIFDIVGKDIEALWDMRELVNKDIEAIWDMSGAVNKDLEVLFDILNAVNKDIEIQYDIFDAVLKDIEIQYDIAELVNKDLQSLWDMAELVNKDIEGVWDIEAGSGTVSKDLVIIYDIYGEVAGVVSDDDFMIMML